MTLGQQLLENRATDEENRIAPFKAFLAAMKNEITTQINDGECYPVAQFAVSSDINTVEFQDHFHKPVSSHSVVLNNNIYIRTINDYLVSWLKKEELSFMLYLDSQYSYTSNLVLKIT